MISNFSLNQRNRHEVSSLHPSENLTASQDSGARISEGLKVSSLNLKNPSSKQNQFFRITPLVTTAGIFGIAIGLGLRAVAQMREPFSSGICLPPSDELSYFSGLAFHAPELDLQSSDDFQGLVAVCDSAIAKVQEPRLSSYLLNEYESLAQEASLEEFIVAQAKTTLPRPLKMPVGRNRVFEVAADLSTVTLHSKNLNKSYTLALKFELDPSNMPKISFCEELGLREYPDKIDFRADSLELEAILLLLDDLKQIDQFYSQSDPLYMENIFSVLEDTNTEVQLINTQESLGNTYAPITTPPVLRINTLVNTPFVEPGDTPAGKPSLGVFHELLHVHQFNGVLGKQNLKSEHDTVLPFKLGLLDLSRMPVLHKWTERPDEMTALEAVVMLGQATFTNAMGMGNSTSYGEDYFVVFREPAYGALQEILDINNLARCEDFKFCDLDTDATDIAHWRAQKLETGAQFETALIQQFYGKGSDCQEKEWEEFIY